MADCQAALVTVWRRFRPSGAGRLVLLLASMMLSGCGEPVSVESLAPKAEVALARDILSDISAWNFRAVEKRLEAKLRTPATRDAIQKMSGVFPREVPRNVELIGFQTSIVNGDTSYSLSFQHEYSRGWVLSNVLLHRRAGTLEIAGVHVEPAAQSLAMRNRFSFEGKGALHYLVLVLAVVIPVFIVSVLVLCLRTPIPRRRWLWLLFIACGIGRISLNWTDGEYQFAPLMALLFGVGAFKPGLYGAWTISVAMPVGATVFLFRRRRFLASAASGPVAGPTGG